MSGRESRRTVNVRIAGHEYKLRGDGDEEELVRIAGYVDRAMDRVRERTGTVDSLDVAVLTCLNLAREILALHERPSSGADRDKLRALISRVESALASQGIGYRQESITPSVGNVRSEGQSRMLELPSVESIRERLATGAPNADARSSETPAQPRVAAGGRDRVG